MKKLVIILFVLCGIIWIESLHAQNAITYWKDGVPTIIYSPDSIFFWNGDNLIPDISDVDEEGGNVEPTEEEQMIMQMTSDEDEAPIDNYSEEDSLKYDAMAQEVLAMFATDNDDFDNDSPMQRKKVNGTGTDDEIQDIIRNNGNNIFDNQLIIEQQNWNSGLWGKTHYGGFNTYYGTFMEKGKRYLLVVFYYSGGFPNKKTAYIKLGQVNSGKIIGKTTIYPGRKYASIRVCIDDYLIDYGCVNFFPLLITEGSNARNYLNPIFVKSKKIVPDDWADLPYGTKFGRINGIPLYCNTSGKKNQGSGYYQCVELCKRYVTELFPDISRSYSSTWGNAWNWPENRSNENGQDKDKYIVFTNGDRQVREGDQIVWRWQYWNSKLNEGKGGWEWTGHIGVVIKTTPTYISIAHQNGGDGTNALPIGTTLKKENDYVKDIKPGTNNSPIFATSHPITHFIRRYHSSEDYTSYSASLRASTTKIEFDTVKVGQSKTITFKIKNSGTSELTISSMSLSKGRVFSIDASSSTIGQGETKTFTVTFTPTNAEEYKDRLVIRSNADDNPIWTIYLFGTGEGGTAVDGQIVMARKYLVNTNRGDHYCYQQSLIYLDNGTYIEIRYHDADYWNGSYSYSHHGIFVAAYKSGENSIAAEEWFIAPVVKNEWINEKIIIGSDGTVQYFMNGTDMGTHQFDKISFEGAQNLTLGFSPYGWWYTHYHYMDNFKIITPATEIIDNFNDGILNSDIWKTPVNPDGVREEEGILKMEQIRTDKDFGLNSKPIRLF